MDAPTPVNAPAVPAVTANFIQADSISIAVDDATGVISATVVISFFAQPDPNGPKTFARDATGRKITTTITVPDVVARATKRAGQGSTLMEQWLGDSLALIPDELARTQVEAQAVTAAAAVVSAAKAQRAADVVAGVDPTVLVADIAAVSAAQTALSQAQANAV